MLLVHFLPLILALLPPIQLLIFIEWFLGYVLSSYHIVSYLVVIAIPSCRYYYCQFFNEDTEVQRVEVIHAKPHSYQWPGKELTSSSLRCVFFPYRASIVQKRIIYFQDEGSLTKKLCEQGKNMQWERAKLMKGGLFSPNTWLRELRRLCFLSSSGSCFLT